MWSTISRLFVAKPRSSTKTLDKIDDTSFTTTTTELTFDNNYYREIEVNGLTQAQTNLAVHVFESMDRNMGDDSRRRDFEQSAATDVYETRQAKQRASVKWLLSKAFNNRVPDNLHEPYYRDHEDQEHLKPQIVHSLSNAELYCLALANIYSDPNYHNQNHSGILQALARKGVYVSEPNNSTLTETILIQNSPLKMSAHMAVIEGLMVLYAKEVVTNDRVVAAIKRFNPQAHVDLPSDHEKGLLLWISHASNALVIKIKQDNDSNDKTTRLPELPDTKDFQSLCDGVGLAAVIAFYCPGEINWQDIKVSKRPSVADALHNLSLVHGFCMRCLPYSIFHMQPEDVTYMRGSMKQNLVVFLADMYNVLEIHPVKCVRYPGEERAMQYLDVGRISAPVSVRKSQSLHQTAESHSYDDRRGGSEDNFVIHRNKGIPTLSSVTDDKLIKFEAAGRPSNWEDQRRSSYAGRRSRRNSVTDDSQLTIENFGGSQDNLQNFGCIRNPDKEMGHSGKRIIAEPTLPARSMMQDVYGSDVQNILADNGYSNDEPIKTSRLRRQISNTNINNSSIPIKNILHSTDNDNNDEKDNKKMASFATYGKQNTDKISNFKLMEQENNEIINKSSFNIKKHGQSNGNGNGNGIGGGGGGAGDKKTTFATFPNTTTWQQQSTQQHQQSEQNSNEENGGGVMASQLNNIRLKLEEKRRHIENEKRKMEVVMSKQRQKIGKTAFLQAVTKGKVKSPSSSTSGGDSPVEHALPTPMSSSGGGCDVKGGDTFSSINSTLIQPQQTVQDKPQRPFSLKEIGEDVRDVENKWLEQDGTSPFVETRRTPDIENMDLEQYHQSITQMNSSLSDIQADIQRLASQQNQIQQQHLMTQHQQQMQQQLHQIQSLSQQHIQNYGMPQVNSLTTRLQDNQQGQFYLHDQPQIQRRTWARPVSNQNLGNDVGQINFQQSMDPRFAPQPVYQQDPRNIYQDTRTWGSPPITQQKGFVLHDSSQEQRYLNGGGGGGGGSDHSLQNNQTHHLTNYPASGNIFNQSTATSASPQHRNTVHRISQLINESPEVKKQSIVHHIPISCESPVDKRHNNNNNNSQLMHTPVPAPPVDDMEPQNISFIGNDNDDHDDNENNDLSHGIRHLNITSGSRTYRIPSPTKPTTTTTTTTISRNSFQPLRESVSPLPQLPQLPPTEIKPLDQLNESSEKGFYISFDSDTPKKPKPTLRVKRSPKKERTVSSFIENEDFTRRPESPPINTMERQRHIEAQRDLERERQRQADEREQQRQEMRDRELQREITKERQRETRQNTDDNRISGVGLVIGNQLSNPDPNSIDEMERKKERIMMLSMQRRQQQEELKERKEAEIQARRDKEKMKEEERARKKEEDRQRRATILEQHKLKKAIEEAEREGKVIDKELLNAIKPTPKLRNKTASARQRPKTIHVDHSSELDSGTLTPSRGKKGSSSNLSTASLTSPTIKRDYFRGSQDTLIAAHCDDRRGGPFYRGGSLKVSSVDSPDDGRGCSPCRSTTQLGRRGSYKTSRDTQEPQQQIRGRTKYPTYQNFKGRKSNSLMNLCDTDSGLGRATPPRRAPSPGMGSTKHLPSPSGPGSLPPGLMSKRKFDDGSSDISSTASSMMDYNGPRLYKQPTTKSNRGIMLNAVEYCVFPGTVNRDAKRRVLDEIARSESKHFLILFRDAGCQFRALYSYCPDREEITKLCGTGPKQVLDNMFDRFFKYNSGGKCFSQVHTKHLTVTIDAFTIHNSLWQGKKVNLPNKKDMALVI